MHHSLTLPPEGYAVIENSRRTVSFKNLKFKAGFIVLLGPWQDILKMFQNSVFICLLQFVIGYAAACIGVLVGHLFPFNTPITDFSTFLNPLLPLENLFLGLGSNVITICLTILAIVSLSAFIFAPSLPCWFCAIILLSHAVASYAIKMAWVSP